MSMFAIIDKVAVKERAGMTAEQNLRLLEELDQNRSFLLLAYASNPKLLANAELRIRQLFEPLPEPSAESTRPAAC